MQDYLLDRQNNKYELDILYRNETGFNADIYDADVCIGEIKWFFSAPGILMIDDLLLHEKPIVRRRWPLSLIPHKIQEYFAKNYRGRGLGTAMLNYIIAHAKELGIKEIRGFVNQDDATETPYLLDFYRRHGFIMDEEAIESGTWPVHFYRPITPQLPTE